MKRILTTKTEQLLLGTVMFACCVLMIATVLVMLPMPAEIVQLAHTATQLAPAVTG